MASGMYEYKKEFFQYYLKYSCNRILNIPHSLRYRAQLGYYYNLAKTGFAQHYPKDKLTIQDAHSTGLYSTN